MAQETPKVYHRFSPMQRFAHNVLVIVFLSLVLTGLPQKYSDAGWAKTIINLLDGIESLRFVHHMSAILLILLVIHHLLAVGHWLWVRGGRASLIPKRKDLTDARDWLLFNLGLRRERPQMPYFNFGEKWDYWFVAISLLILMLTGFVLWNPIAATKLLPGESIPLARLIHGAQALIMLVGIGTWHLYSVFIKQFNRSMLTGKLSQSQMETEHALALVDQPPLSNANPSRRQTYIFAAGGMALIALGAIYYFATFEDTSIESFPHRQEIVFISPSEDGDATTGAFLWETLRCGQCHGADAGGSNDGPALVAQALTFEEFFFQVREGGKDMPAFSREEVSDKDTLDLYAWIEDIAQ